MLEHFKQFILLHYGTCFTYNLCDCIWPFSMHDCALKIRAGNILNRWYCSERWLRKKVSHWTNFSQIPCETKILSFCVFIHTPPGHALSTLTIPLLPEASPLLHTPPLPHSATLPAISVEDRDSPGALYSTLVCCAEKMKAHLFYLVVQVQA